MPSPSLYEEVELIENAINEILYGEEEINIEALDTLMSAKVATIQNGLESLCKIRARKMAAITALTDESKRLAEKAARESKSLGRLEEYIHSMLKRSGEKKLEAGTFTVGTRISNSVWVAPDFNNPQYMRTKTTVEPDKTAIRDAIKAGTQIDGAAIVTKENLSIK